MGPGTRYARSGDVHIAYEAAGDGPDLLYVPTWVSQMEELGAEPRMAAFIERLCSFSRLISFDRRGSGLSDPVLGAPTLEEQIDDVIAVMDAVGSKRTAVVASLEGGPLAITFAATHPDRVSALILYATFARTRWAEDYDFVPTDAERAGRLDETIAQWGQGAIPMQLAPSRAGVPSSGRGPDEWSATRPAPARSARCSRPSARPTYATCSRRSRCRRS